MLRHQIVDSEGIFYFKFLDQLKIRLLKDALFITHIW
jgi:hypothetical protein